MGNRPADAQRLSKPTDLGPRKRDWPLVVRRARESDKAAVLSFATNTWDGWDYIPHAWPVWLAATDGVMLVGCRPDDDRPVAITRIAMVSPTESWWEGIRVDPALRGMEVAADLQVAELHWTAAQGANVIRYATSARNEGSHRLGARDGIKLLVPYHNFWWSPDAGDPHDPSAFDPAVQAQATALRVRVLDALAADGHILAAADADRRWLSVVGSDSFQVAERLYEPRPWALGELTPQRFRRHVERGEVIASQRATAILLREQLAGEDSSLRLALLLGNANYVVEMVGRLRDIAGTTVRFRLPVAEELAAIAGNQLLGMGYQLGESQLHVLGRPIDAVHPVPEIDPTRLILADPPQPIIKPPEF